MGKTIANVLVGEATLYVRQPNDAIAEWSTAKSQAGSHSVKLYKDGSGNAGSTHLQLTPPAGITFTTFCDNATAGGATAYSFYHLCQDLGVGVTANFVQMEFRFEDPDSEAWCEFTVMGMQTYDSTGGWLQLALNTIAGNNICGYGGIGETGLSFFEYSTLIPITGAAAAISGIAEVTDCGPWILSRVRLELWEPEPARYAYIDTVVLNGVAYAIEPGDASAAGLSLSSPFEEVGYTEDGVTMEYAAEQTDIMVHEETFAVGSPIIKESITITCNMAEASLVNMNNAMAGAVLSGNIITFGDGVNKTMNLKIEGTSPAGFLRAIHIPKAVASGTVGMSYKKGEKTIIPVAFKVLKTQDSPACTIVDNAA